MYSINDFANFTTSVGAGNPRGSAHLDAVHPAGQVVNDPAPKASAFDSFGFIMAVEGGEVTAEEYREGMQHLIDSGLVWQLQGSWGRAAMAAINQGICHK